LGQPGVAPLRVWEENNHFAGRTKWRRNTKNEPLQSGKHRFTKKGKTKKELSNQPTRSLAQQEREVSCGGGKMMPPTRTKKKQKQLESQLT